MEISLKKKITKNDLCKNKNIHKVNKIKKPVNFSHKKQSLKPINHPSVKILEKAILEDFRNVLKQEHKEALEKHIISFKREFHSLKRASSLYSGIDLKKFILSQRDPSLRILSKEIGRALFYGSGVFLLKNFPLTEQEDLEISTFVFICYLGLPVYNNRDKIYVWSVVPQQIESSKYPQDANYRIGNTGLAVGFHTDTSTLAGLLCIKQAQEGGENEIISAVAVHNKILKTRPDLLKVLYSNFFIDRRGEEMPGEKPYAEIPIFKQTKSGQLLAHWTRLYTYEAYRKYDVKPLTNLQQEALEYLVNVVRSIASSQKVVFKAQPGDFLLLNNNLVFHNRLAFKGDRHLLRVWIYSKKHSALPHTFGYPYQ
ncbi:MAG: TauD/TfdA family dioxygenase [Proteobacteria bacterium]|nr:TauD/TfdA family dioxygenase [Pseudomonadota bacterium]